VTIMTKLLSRMDVLMRRFERAAWVVLGIAAFAIPWFGFELPLMQSDDALGAGYVWLDWALAAMMLVAVSAQIARIVLAPPDEPAVTRLAAWLMLLALCLMTGRITWTLFVQGDLYLTITTSVAITCLCASILLHAGGRVVYGGAHVTDYGEFR